MGSRPTLPYYAPASVLPGPLPTLEEIFKAKQLPSARQAVTGVVRVREYFIVKFGRYVLAGHHTVDIDHMVVRVPRLCRRPSTFCNVCYWRHVLPVWAECRSSGCLFGSGVERNRTLNKGGRMTDQVSRELGMRQNRSLDEVQMLIRTCSKSGKKSSKAIHKSPRYSARGVCVVDRKQGVGHSATLRLCFGQRISVAPTNLSLPERPRRLEGRLRQDFQPSALLCTKVRRV